MTPKRVWLQDLGYRHGLVTSDHRPYTKRYLTVNSEVLKTDEQVWRVDDKYPLEVL